MKHAFRQAVTAIVVVIGLAPLATMAAGGPFGIDHPVNFDDGGIWRRHDQKVLEYGSLALVITGALSEGDGTRLGHTSWQAIDSVVIGVVSAEALKLVFSRSRPSQGDDPNAWFKGHGHKSFPSDEVTQLASLVTPFVLEYGAEAPAVYALELLPLYTAVARVKARAHWQSDVLAGFALGTAVGWYAHSRPSSLVVGVLPGGVTIGWRKQF